MEWYVIFGVVDAVAVATTLGVWDQDRGSRGDAIHDPNQIVVVYPKFDSFSYPYVEIPGGAFLLGDQFVPVFRVTEHVVGDGLKPRRCAVAVNPNQHFAQVDQFMFHDPLHGRKPIVAPQPANPCPIPRLPKRLKQKAGRQGDFVTDGRCPRAGPPERLTRCLAPRPRHAGTESERHAVGSGKGEAKAFEENLVVGLRHSLEVLARDFSEVFAIHHRRLLEHAAPDGLLPFQPPSPTIWVTAEQLAELGRGIRMGANAGWRRPRRIEIGADGSRGRGFSLHPPLPISHASFPHDC
jgi:hypothetical protein